MNALWIGLLVACGGRQPSSEPPTDPIEPEARAVPGPTRQPSQGFDRDPDEVHHHLRELCFLALDGR